MNNEQDTTTTSFSTTSVTSSEGNAVNPSTTTGDDATTTTITNTGSSVSSNTNTGSDGTTTTRRPKKSLDDIDFHYYDWFDDIDIEESSLGTEIDKALESDVVFSYLANITDDIHRYIVTEDLRRCPSSTLCGVSLNVYVGAYYYDFQTTCCRQCFCEPDCVGEGNCCPDAPWLLQSSSETFDKGTGLPDGVVRTCLQRGVPDKGDPLNDRIERIKAITGCPIGTDEELSSKCNQDYLLNKNNISLYDVTFASNNVEGKIYRNVYCGLCNGENIQQLTLWQPELACQFSAQINFKSTSEILPSVLSGTASCDVVFGIPDDASLFIESCSLYVSRCNVTGNWETYNATIDAACEFYGHPVEIELDGETEGFYFRNAFCAICNGFSPDKFACLYSTNYNEKYSFSGLLRLRDSPSENTERSMECPTGQQFDKVKMNCRDIHCAYGREYINQKCMAVTHMQKFQSYFVTFRVEPVNDVSSPLASEMAPMVGRLLYDTIVVIETPNLPCGPDVLLFTTPCDADINNGTAFFNSTHLEFYELRYKLEYEQNHNSTRLVQKILGLNMKYIGQENNSIAVLDDKELETGSYEALFRIKVTNTNNTRFDSVYEIYDDLVKNNATNDIENTIVGKDYHTCTFLVQLNGYCRSYEYLDIIDLRPCPMFNLTLGEFELEQTSDGLYTEQYNVVLDVSEYSIRDDMDANHILICLDTYNEKFVLGSSDNDSDGEMAEMILSIILVSISVVCLCFTLFTYGLFSQLRTLPGKNNMALATWLLVAQIMFLVGSFAGFDRGTVQCKIIGVLTHFCWLVALFWMQICTFHMYRVLSKMRVADPSTGNTKYTMYHLYSVIMSVVFVLINVTVSMVTSDNSDMGYGVRTCYISTQSMIGWTFGLPAAIIVLSNLVCFCIIIIKLKRAPDVNKNVQNERNYILVFARLSTITGLTWTFGLIYIWTGLVVLSYIFTILNASQGLFIILGFVCNKRTLDLYKGSTMKFHSSASVRSNKTGSTSL